MTYDEVSRDDLESLRRKTGFDFITLYQNLVNFFSVTSPSIKRQYETGVQNDSKAFDDLKRLKREVDKALDFFTKNRETFTDYKFWVILDDLEDSKSQFLQLDNYEIWSRNNSLKNFKSGRNQIDYVLEQGETLEDVERKLFSANPDSTWYDLALKNDLKEEDYDYEGGTPLKVSFKGRGANSFIRTTVGHIDEGKKIYGKDIKRKISFENDDLKVLDYIETKLQSVEILSGLKKGDNPQQFEDGLDQNSILGTNKSSLLFPSIFRQMTEVFATDDSFSGIQIKKIEIEGDALFINFDIFTRFNEIENSTIRL